MNKVPAAWVQIAHQGRRSSQLLSKQRPFSLKGTTVLVMSRCHLNTISEPPHFESSWGSRRFYLWKKLNC